MSGSTPSVLWLPVRGRRWLRARAGGGVRDHSRRGTGFFAAFSTAFCTAFFTTTAPAAATSWVVLFTTLLLLV